MIRILTILCLMAAPAFGLWAKGHKRTYGSFVSLPKNCTEASKSSYIQVDRPALPTGYNNLTMMCPQEDYIVCLLFDDTEYVAGMQIAINPDKFSGAVFDWEEAGFTNWTVPFNGTNTTFWATHVLYLSMDYAATSKESRLASRNDSILIQGSYYYVTGFNGTLIEVPVSETEMESSVYTSQQCMVGMGNHWYYNMSSSLTCSVNTISTWFPLMYENQAVAVGFLLPGVYTAGTGIDPFETPSESVIKYIVPRGPQCLYDYANSPGVITMHLYFIEHPYYILCLSGQEYINEILSALGISI